MRLQELIASIQDMASRVGGVFVPDDLKIAAWRRCHCAACGDALQAGAFRHRVARPDGDEFYCLDCSQGG